MNKLEELRGRYDPETLTRVGALAWVDRYLSHDREIADEFQGAVNAAIEYITALEAENDRLNDLDQTQSKMLLTRIGDVEGRITKAYYDGINYAIYETWKELDLPIKTHDIRNNERMSNDEKCEEFARRISEYIKTIESE